MKSHYVPLLTFAGGVCMGIGACSQSPGLLLYGGFLLCMGMFGSTRGGKE